MKKILFLILIISGIISAQDVQISNSDIYSVDIPHLSFYGPTVGLTYGTNFNFYKFGISGPTSPIENPVVPADNYGPNTTDIAIDDTDPNHIAIAYDDYHYDYGSGVAFYGLFLVESTDGGDNWNDPVLLDTIKLGSSLDNMLYYIPQVNFANGDLYVLGKVHSNSSVMNAIYLWYNNEEPIRLDDSSNDDLEQAIAITIEKHGSENWVALSYGKMSDGEVKFYLRTSKSSGLPVFSDAYIAANDGTTFITSDNHTKAFINEDGTVNYIYSSFSHGPQLMVSNNWGVDWQTGGAAESHKYVYVGFERISENYYVKIMLDDNNDLRFYVSSDLLNWQAGGKFNSDAADISWAGAYVDMIIDPDSKTVSSAWIDNRTGNAEIFYANLPLPELVGVEEDIAEISDFSLSQNYPNPFNPATVIRYSVPSVAAPSLVEGQQQVTLKVYDILGNEVATLVNENQEAGNYEVEFNGSNLVSGMYIYQLNAGSYKSVKKMMLLK